MISFLFLFFYIGYGMDMALGRKKHSVEFFLHWSSLFLHGKSSGTMDRWIFLAMEFVWEMGQVYPDSEMEDMEINI